MPIFLDEELITSSGKAIHLHTDNPKIVNHWQTPGCYAGTILKQINEERIYASIFEGRKDLTVLDLGANIGLFSLYVSDIAKLIVAVEPTPDHFYILSNLTAEFENIRCVNVAASNSGDDVTFYLHTQNSTANSLLKYDPNSPSITVKGMTIPMILDASGLSSVDFCKIDIEGSEEYVVTDESIEQAKDRVGSWYMEVHPTHFGDYSFNLQNFMSMFGRHGYTAKQVTADGFFASKIQ